MQLWDGIEEFVRVAEKGSFSGAAQHMGLSKSHISKHVKKLENRLGVTLIHRTTRKLKLTNQGQVFFLKCQAIIHDLEEARAQLVNDTTTPKGHIRLTTAGAFGEDYLSPIIAEFLKEYPDVSIDVTFTNRKVDLLEEQFDLAIRSSITNATAPHSERLFLHPLITAASPKYFEGNDIPQTVSDLKNHNCLCGTLSRWRFQVNGNIREIAVTGNWHSNNGRALVNAAKAALGIIQVPDFYVTEAIAQGDLVEVLNDHNIENNSFWAIYPKSHHAPRKTQMLVEYVRDKLNQLS